MDNTFIIYRPASSDMCDALFKVARLGQPVLWTANPNVRAGDRCLIYTVRPRSAVVGTGVASSDAFVVKSGEWAGQTCIYLRLLTETSLTLREMKRSCRWGALRGNSPLRATRFGPHGKGYGNARLVPKPHDDVLWNLAFDPTEAME